MSDYFKHPKLGMVKYTIRNNATRLTARWKDGIVNVSIPSFYTSKMVLTALDNLCDKILKIKPEEKNDILFTINSTVEFDSFSVEVVSCENSGIRPFDSGFRYGIFSGQPRIIVGKNTDISSHGNQICISKICVDFAKELSIDILRPTFREICSSLNVRDIQLKIGSGKKTLGRCSSSRVITLSCFLSFYPKHLREYIICHELAHLKEFNHSPLFHAICDKYCKTVIGKSESALNTELNKFKLPLVLN